MRVLIINSMFASSVYRRCADELGALEDIELTVLTVDSWVMNSKDMALDSVQVGAPYRLISGPTVWKGRENRGFYIAGLARAIRESKPEVIFLMEEPFSLFALQTLAACRVLAPSAPVINFTWNNLSLQDFDYRPSIVYRSIAKYVLPKISFGLTANTQGIDVLRSEGFSKPINDIGYGVDSLAFTPRDPELADKIRAQFGFRPSDIVVGYVGRLKWMKGIDLLVEAMGSIRQSHPNVRLLLVGSGEDESLISQLILNSGLKGSTVQIPSVSQEQVPDLMSVLDILVLPSRRVGMWAEQFGRVLVEAMAAGKVVIGSTSGAIPEVIGDGGFTFEENNSHDLVNAIKKALAMSSSEKEALLLRAGRRATEHYTWKRFARDVHAALSYVTHKEVTHAG